MSACASWDIFYKVTTPLNVLISLVDVITDWINYVYIHVAETSTTNPDSHQENAQTVLNAILGLCIAATVVSFLEILFLFMRYKFYSEHEDLFNICWEVLSFLLLIVEDLPITILLHFVYFKHIAVEVGTLAFNIAAIAALVGAIYRLAVLAATVLKRFRSDSYALNPSEDDEEERKKSFVQCDIEWNWIYLT